MLQLFPDRRRLGEVGVLSFQNRSWLHLAFEREALDFPPAIRERHAKSSLSARRPRRIGSPNGRENGISGRRSQDFASRGISCHVLGFRTRRFARGPSSRSRRSLWTLSRGTGLAGHWGSLRRRFAFFSLCQSCGRTRDLPTRSESFWAATEREILPEKSPERGSFRLQRPRASA